MYASCKYEQCVRDIKNMNRKKAICLHIVYIMKNIRVKEKNYLNLQLRVLYNIIV